MATIRGNVGHLETLPIDLLYAHLDAPLVANYLETMNGGPNFSSANRAPQKSGFITCGWRIDKAVKRLDSRNALR
jgi:hypothetical protein